MCFAEPNEYNGETRVSVKIRDLRPEGLSWEDYWTDLQIYEKLLRHEPLTEKEHQRVLPEREHVAIVYRFLKKARCFPVDYDRLSIYLSPMPYCRIRACVEILKELHLILVQDEITVYQNPQKTNIESSRLLQRLRTIERVKNQ